MEPDFETRSLSKFKEILGDLFEEDVKLQDCDLLRFLRARNHDLDKAEQMLRNNLDWKKRTQIDKAGSFDVVDVVKNAFPSFYDGVDKDGRAVIYLPVGHWPTRKFLLDGYRSEMDKNIYRVMADVTDVVESSGWDKFTLIIDLEGLSYLQVMHYESLQLVLRVLMDYEQNFPERLHLAFVINAPWILNIVFPTIKRIIRGATMDKLKIFDGNADNFLPALVDAVPPSGFPQGFKKYHGKLFETWCSANI